MFSCASIVFLVYYFFYKSFDTYIKHVFFFFNSKTIIWLDNRCIDNLKLKDVDIYIVSLLVYCFAKSKNRYNISFKKEKFWEYEKKIEKTTKTTSKIENESRKRIESEDENESIKATDRDNNDFGDDALNDVI